MKDYSFKRPLTTLYAVSGFFRIKIMNKLAYLFYQIFFQLKIYCAKNKKIMQTDGLKTKILTFVKKVYTKLAIFSIIYTLYI